MGLGSGHKSALTTLASDLDTAINGLTGSDPYQAGVRAVLQNMRLLLSTITAERNQ